MSRSFPGSAHHRARHLFLRAFAVLLIILSLGTVHAHGGEVSGAGGAVMQEDCPVGAYRRGVVIVRFAEGRVPSEEGMNLRAGVFGNTAVDNLLNDQEVTRIDRMLPATRSVRSLSGRRLQRTFVVYYNGAIDAATLAASLGVLDDIELARVDQYFCSLYFGEKVSIPNDGEFPNQWSLDYPRDSVDVDMPEAWAIERGDPDQVLGVLDTGAMVDTSGHYQWKLHSDFHYFLTEEDNAPFGMFNLNWGDIDLVDSADDDALGDDPDFPHLDNVFGYNFADTNDAETNAKKIAFWRNTPLNWVPIQGSEWAINFYNKHGLNVAGIAVADAGFGGANGIIAGIAGDTCRVYFVRRQLPVTDVTDAKAIISASDFASVINMSFGYCTEPGVGTQIWEAMQYALDERDIVFVAAVGNKSTLDQVGCAHEVTWPARWEFVLGVGNMDSTLTLYEDSVYGPDIGDVDLGVCQDFCVTDPSSSAS